MRVAPTADEIAIATSVLRRLTPEQLSEYSELREAGCALFKRDIVKAAFSSDDAVAYLKKQSAQRQTLKELRRLSAHIAQEHAAARETRAARPTRSAARLKQASATFLISHCAPSCVRKSINFNKLLKLTVP